MKIFHAQDPAHAAEAAAETLNEFLKANRGNAVLLLFSGGSALAISDFVGEELLAENLTVSVVDERFTADPALSNFAAMQATPFYELAQDKGVSFIGTLPRPGETLAQISHRFGHALDEWRTEHPQGKIFAVLGMGADGHTAGIFPLKTQETEFRRLFLGQDRVVGYNNGGQKPPPERFTVTLSFFKLIDQAVIFVSGQEKKPVLEAVLEKIGKLNELPALGWQEIKSAEIFTDLG